MRRLAPMRVGTPGSGAFLAALALALTGIALSWWMARQAAGYERAALERRFEFAAERLEAEVLARLSRPLDGLVGARGLYAASQQVTLPEFRDYVMSRELPRDFPGIRGFGVITRIPRAGLAALEAEVRAEGGQDFRVRSSGEMPDLFVIKYIEPLARNRGAWGYDIGSETHRREAAEQAMRSGKPTMTRRIVLLQDEQRSPGFLLLLPLYKGRTVPSTPLQREAALEGFLYAPVVAAELFRDITAVTEGAGVSLELLDDSAQMENRRVYAETGAGGEASSAWAQSLARERPLEFAGRHLTLRLAPSQAFEKDAWISYPWWLGVAGSLASLLLAATVFLLASGRRRAEARALQLTSDVRRLAAVAERTTNAVMCTDASQRITWINEGFSRLTGYTLDEVLGRTPSELLAHPDADPAVLKALDEAGREGRPLRVEVCNRHKNGEAIWVDTDLQPVRDEHGQLEGFIEISVDVSERRRVERMRQLARREIDALLEVVKRHAIVSMTDVKGRIISVNPAFVAISQYSEAELLGQDHRLLNSGFHPPEFWAHVWALLGSGQSWRGQICNRAKDGSLYWVDSIIAPILDEQGQVERFVSIRHDITASKQANAQLRRQRQRLEHILEATAAGTWEWQVTSDEIECNERWAEMLGRHLEALRPIRAQLWRDWVHPLDRPGAERLLGQHLAGQSAAFDTEMRMQHRDGHWVWVHIRGKVVERDAQGRPLLVSGTQLDISVRKQAEIALEQKQQLLDRAERLAGMCAWELDLGSRVLKLSDQAWSVLRLDPHEPLSLERLLDALKPDSRHDLQQALDVAQRGAQGWDLELELGGDASPPLWLHAVGEAVFDDSGPVRLVGAFADISQRRALEASLRQNNLVLSTVLENLPCALSVFDAQLHLIASNRQFRSLLGLPDALFEGEVTRFEDIVRFNVLRGDYGPVDDVDAAVNAAVERARHPQAHQFERTRPNGVTLEVRGAPLPGGGFVTTYVDVSQRQQLERARRELNELLTAVLQSLPCGLTVHDQNMVITLHNERYNQLYGIEPALWEQGPARIEVMAERFWRRGDYGDISLEQAIAAARLRAQQAMQGPHRWERYRADVDLHLEIRSEPLASGGFVSTYVDVSEQRRAQRELHRAEALLRVAIDTIDEAFVLFDPQDRLVLCNEKYRQLYAASADLIQPGVSFEELIRKGAERGQYAEALGREEAWVQERLAAHRRADTSLTQQVADGRWIRVVERRMPDGHLVGFRVDITDLMHATQAAQQASEAKSLFLANMSHEIRTPMNAILGMLKLLQRTPLDGRQRDYASKTEGAARSLLALLNDLLDFSKVEAGKMTLDPQPFQLEQLLRDLSVILSAFIGAKPVELLYDIDARLPEVLLGDSLRLQQVLVNLAGNAVKFTPQGEVVLALRRLAGHPGAVRIEFSVSDTGIGIAPENQERIFSGFTQAESSITRRFGGTGLGLSISARLVQMMGGQIALDSEPGRGSRFSFVLELPLGPTAAREARDSVGARVLLLHPHPASAGLLQRMLQQSGHQALALESMAALTPALLGQGADLLVLDAQFLGQDVRQACLRLRALDWPRAPRLVLLATAVGHEEIARQCVDEPGLVDAVLVKPVTPRMLIEVLEAPQPSAAERTAPAPEPPPHRLAGMRLLLVEDNLYNQQVAQELLQDEGAVVALADDGRQAVDMLKAEPEGFDAVLMDVQMQVMDGLTATRLIRGELGLERLPIIAMTANAMEEDRQACLNAGMNTHVGKPFDIHQLVDVLRRCVAESRRAAPNTRAADPEEAAILQRLEARLRALPPLDPALLEAAAAQGVDLQPAYERVMGRRALFERMCQGLAQACEALSGEMTQARQAEDTAAGRQCLHTLKGLAASVGAQEFADTAAQGEQRCADGELPDAAWCDALAQRGRELSQALKGWCERLPAQP